MMFFSRSMPAWSVCLVRKMYLPHCRACTKQTVSREVPARSSYTVLCAMMRTAQQQAVAWFTLSRGVLVHATLTSTQLKCVARTIQSGEWFNRIADNNLFWWWLSGIVVLIITEKCVWYLCQIQACEIYWLLRNCWSTSAHIHKPTFNASSQHQDDLHFTWTTLW